jgi:hypothetical protein
MTFHVDRGVEMKASFYFGTIDISIQLVSRVLSGSLYRFMVLDPGHIVVVKALSCRHPVVYRRAADHVSRPLPYHLSAINQPGISPLTRLATSRPPLLACI